MSEGVSTPCPATEPTGDTGPTDDGDPGRVITLTDGVVAIAMTLLALDLKPDLPAGVSSHELGRYFGDHAGSYVAFGLAFGLVAQYWSVNHKIMAGVTRHSSALGSATLLFLFGITLVPVTTYLQGAYDADLATSVFAANLFLISVSLTAVSEVIDRRGLRAVPYTDDQRMHAHYREAATITIPLAIAVLAWFVPHVEYLFLTFLFADVPGDVARRWRVARTRG